MLENQGGNVLMARSMAHLAHHALVFLLDAPLPQHTPLFWLICIATTAAVILPKHNRAQKSHSSYLAAAAGHEL